MAVTRIDHAFLQQCESVKKESFDPDRQVGAVVASGDGELLAVGTNQPPEETGLDRKESFEAIARDPNWKYFMLEHAERNAIRNARHAGRSLDGATMYGTLFPCADCARAIVASGIKRLVVPKPGADPDRDEKWQTHFHYALETLELAGIRLELVSAADFSGT